MFGCVLLGRDGGQEREGARLRRALRFVLNVVEDDAVDIESGEALDLLLGDVRELVGCGRELRRSKTVEADARLTLGDLLEQGFVDRRHAPLELVTGFA